MSKCLWVSKDIFFLLNVGINYSRFATLSAIGSLASKMHYRVLYKKLIINYKKS